MIVPWKTFPFSTYVGQRHAPVALRQQGQRSRTQLTQGARTWCLFAHLTGCLSNEIDHTFRHQAHRLRLGSRTCWSERITLCKYIWHRLRSAVPRSANDARVVCIQHSQDRMRLPHSHLGILGLFAGLPRPHSPLTLVHSTSLPHLQKTTPPSPVVQQSIVC